MLQPVDKQSYHYINLLEIGLVSNVLHLLENKEVLRKELEDKESRYVSNETQLKNENIDIISFFNLEIENLKLHIDIGDLKQNLHICDSVTKNGLSFMSA